MLGTGIGYSTRAVNALNPRTTSPALFSIVTEISSAVFIQLFVFLFNIMCISHSRAKYMLSVFIPFLHYVLSVTVELSIC